MVAPTVLEGRCATPLTDAKSSIDVRGVVEIVVEALASGE